MTAFGDAFKSARAAGKTTFKFNGKSYHTKTKEEMDKVRKNVPTPTPRPDDSSDSNTSSANVPTPTPRPDPNDDSDSPGSRANGVQAERNVTTPAAPRSSAGDTTAPDDRFKKKKRTWGDVGLKLWHGEAGDLFN